MGHALVTKEKYLGGERCPEKLALDKHHIFRRGLWGRRVYGNLLNQPSVNKSQYMSFEAGGGELALCGEPVMNPQHTDVFQSIETHVEPMAPGFREQVK